MNTYISILRGINVSGHRLIKMDALKQLCVELQFEQVQTYIQSGNIVFRCAEKDTSTLSEKLKSTITQKYGFDVPVITLTERELSNIIYANPFLQEKDMDEKYFHVTFLSDAPSKTTFELLRGVDLKNDRAEVVNRAIYLYCPDGYSNSKLTNNFIENKLKIAATTRNWKTTKELLSLAVLL